LHLLRTEPRFLGYTDLRLVNEPKMLTTTATISIHSAACLTSCT